MRFATDTGGTFTDLIITFPDDKTKAEISALYTNNTAYIGRITLGTFDATGLITAPVTLPKNRKLTYTGVPLKLSTAAATTLNAALGLTPGCGDEARRQGRQGDLQTSGEHPGRETERDRHD